MDTLCQKNIFGPKIHTDEKKIKAKNIDFGAKIQINV